MEGGDRGVVGGDWGRGGYGCSGGGGLGIGDRGWCGVVWGTGGEGVVGRGSWVLGRAGDSRFYGEDGGGEGGGKEIRLGGGWVFVVDLGSCRVGVCYMSVLGSDGRFLVGF